MEGENGQAETRLYPGFLCLKRKSWVDNKFIFFIKQISVFEKIKNKFYELFKNSEI